MPGMTAHHVECTGTEPVARAGTQHVLSTRIEQEVRPRILHLSCTGAEHVACAETHHVPCIRIQHAVFAGAERVSSTRKDRTQVVV